MKIYFIEGTFFSDDYYDGRHGANYHENLFISINKEISLEKFKEIKERYTSDPSYKYYILDLMEYENNSECNNSENVDDWNVLKTFSTCNF